MKFRRNISSMGLLFAAVGGIVGSGWLFGPMYAAQIAGPAAILSWVIGGFLMILIALTFAELATTFPVAGGMVQFGEMSHGSLVSFTIGWMVWVSSVVVAPVETLALLQYAANYIPGIVKTVSHTKILTGLGITFAAVLMFLMCILNWLGAKFFSKTSVGIVSIKLFVPILTLITLFLIDFHPGNLELGGGFLPYGWHGVFAALPLGGVIFSFIGYSPAIQLAAEAKNPQKTLPFAIIGSVFICIFLYALLQLGFIGALHPSYVVKGWHALSFKGDAGPFAGILMSLGITWLVVVIYADAFISPFGTAYIYTTSTGRVSYALSKIGFFPRSLRKLNKHGAPMRAILVNYFIGLLLFLPFPGWQAMVSFLISCFVIAYSVGPIALLGLRKLQPQTERPFRLPFAHAITLVAFYVCNLLVFWTGWVTVSRLLIALIIGFAVYGIDYYQQLKTTAHAEFWRQARWLLPYLLGIGVISYLGSFGHGKNILTFGPDFIVIAVFTVTIFYFALCSIRRK